MNYSQLIAACRNDGIPCEENAALAPYTSMKIGGACDLLVKTADEKQLLTVLRLCRSENIPHFILGRGSNLLVSSAGWRGAVILLSGEKPEVEARGNSLTAWAGVPLYALCSAALEHSLTGLEFAYGIPGSLGGALYMNAGAYGGEMKDVVTSCRYVGGDGEIHEMSAAEMQLTYRHSVFSGSSMVITSVTMELVPGDKHLNLEDLRHLPNPNKSLRRIEKPQPMKLNILDEKESIFNYVAQKDLLLYYPYHSFEHFTHFLYEAVHNPETREIMVTQYRVAENSAVINTLIAAAQNGKKVTVFVELKARFDEENNLATAEMMQAAGIKIIYSIPGLKVHAKVALVRRRGLNGEKIPSYAYISTGNFNEKTATLYADCGLFTCRKEIVNDLYNLFRTLQGKEDPKFTTLLVARFNLIPELNRLIDREISLADQGKGGRIILKMNALQDPAMIDRLYEASEHGVQIDLIVRGICCLIPEQSYSRNIRVTRIVDSFLEHARIWYFGNEGHPKIYMGSPDWMRRNLYRRIEAVTPILDPDLRASLIEMLHIQLADNQKACWVDDKLQNVFKKRASGTPAVRAQYDFYEWLKKDIVTEM